MTRSQHEVEDVESDEKSVNTDGAVENYDSEQISVFAQRDDKQNSQSLTTGHVFDKIQKTVSAPVDQVEDID